MSDLDYLFDQKNDLYRQKDGLIADVKGYSARITELYDMMNRLPRNQAWAVKQREILYNQIQGLKVQRDHASEGINEIQRSIERVKDEIKTEKLVRRGARGRGDWG